uniref:Uncharacterized protein n=1 Tax=Aegilops tauschii subsp. strangulata TaxID=200361 RepID=A0A453RYP4_AEGTS
MPCSCAKCFLLGIDMKGFFINVNLEGVYGMLFFRKLYHDIDLGLSLLPCRGWMDFGHRLQDSRMCFSVMWLLTDGIS